MEEFLEIHPNVTKCALTLVQLSYDQSRGSPMKGMSYKSAAVRDATRYINDDRWVAEQKMDGVRVLAHIDANRVRFHGRNDSPVAFAAAVQWFARLERELLAGGMPTGTVLDGELIIGTGDFIAFDVPHVPGFVTTSDTLASRRIMLEKLIALVNAPHVSIVPQACSREAKSALWQRVQDERAEGIVVKRANAPYHVGVRTDDVLKIKITHTVDCIVIARDEGGKESATLAMMLNGKPVNVGKCSMIGKTPAFVGDVIEVEYLYLADGTNPRLTQPRMTRLRPDKEAAECSLSQITSTVTNRAMITV